MTTWDEIEFSHPPKINSLYHYQPFNRDWLASLINDRRIKFSAPMGFNDPWDCRPCYNKSFLNDPKKLEEQIQYFVEASRRQTPNVSEEHRQARAQEWRSDKELVKRAIDRSAIDVAKAINDQYRVYCLTPKADCQLMWAHYGASHKGVCLEFSTKNEVFSTALKIKYFEKYPTLNFADNDGLKNILPLITKADVWSYESEYRLISEEKKQSSQKGTLKTDDGFFIVPQNSLISIILGCQTPKEDVEWLQNFLKIASPSVILKQAKRMPDEYKLTVEVL